MPVVWKQIYWQCAQRGKQAIFTKEKTGTYNTDDFKSSQAFLKSSAEDLSQTKQVLFSGWTLQSTKAFLALSLLLLQ